MVVKNVYNGEELGFFVIDGAGSFLVGKGLA